MRILSLGAGVQSSTVALMAERERLKEVARKETEQAVSTKMKLEALTTALSALEKEMRIEAVVAQNFGTKLWADKLAALLAAHPEQP